MKKHSINWITVYIVTIAIMMLGGCDKKKSAPHLTGGWQIDKAQLSNNLNALVKSGKLTQEEAERILDINDNVSFVLIEDRMVWSGHPTWDTIDMTFTTRIQDGNNIIEMKLPEYGIPRRYTLTGNLLVIHDLLFLGLDMPYRRLN